MNMKSVWAVLAGVLFVLVVTSVVDFVLHAVGFFPPMNQPINDSRALVATLYRIVISVIGAWLTARLAPSHPMKHALILGVVGTFLGLVGVIATWNLGLGPRWYAITLAVLAIPQCWVGGMIYVAQTSRGATTSRA